MVSRDAVVDAALALADAGHWEAVRLHQQLPLLLRVSRSVQWLREAAGRKQTFVARALEESALTTLCLSIFAVWMNDDSPGQEETRQQLSSLLEGAEQLEKLLPFTRGGKDG